MSSVVDGDILLILKTGLENFERFLIEYRKSKEVILANHKWRKKNIELIETPSKFL